MNLRGSPVRSPHTAHDSFTCNPRDESDASATHSCDRFENDKITTRRQTLHLEELGEHFALLGPLACSRPNKFESHQKAFYTWGLSRYRSRAPTARPFSKFPSVPGALISPSSSARGCRTTRHRTIRQIGRRTHLQIMVFFRLDPHPRPIHWELPAHQTASCRARRLRRYKP